MANPIVPKKSSTPGAVPTSGQLLTGEIAVNTADGKLFVKKSDNTVVAISGSGTPTAYSRRFAWSSPYSYSGRADTGSATSASVWTIKRSQVSASGAVTATLTATGVAWDNYASASYS